MSNDTERVPRAERLAKTIADTLRDFTGLRVTVMPPLVEAPPAQDVIDELTLILARADGQTWVDLDDAPARARFMGYQARAIAALDWVESR
jgi:hypothetical protein